MVKIPAPISSLTYPRNRITLAIRARYTTQDMRLGRKQVNLAAANVSLCEWCPVAARNGEG